MREVLIQISKSNVIDSLMPLLLSTSVLNEGDVVKDIFVKDMLFDKIVAMKLIVEKES